MKNVDENVVNDFGSEWGKFDQSDVSTEELREIWKKYFSLFPWTKLPLDAKGFDLGCGSGQFGQFLCSQSKGTALYRSCKRSSRSGKEKSFYVFKL